MGKNKLAKFAENKTFPHLFEPPYEEVCRGPFRLRGRWGAEFFANENPIALELGCGRGEYTVALSRLYPERNFIGMDIKGARLWRGAKDTVDAPIRNVAFIRGRVETLTSFFAPNEVSEIWITFPDPQLKIRREKRRLTSPGFLYLYHQVLAPKGVIHLKTDSAELFAYTQSVVKELGCTVLDAYEDIDGDAVAKYPILATRTRYEEQFRAKGKAITYLSFQLPERLEVDASLRVCRPLSSLSSSRACDNKQS